MDCKTCEYKVECEKEHGEEREDGDDYRVVIGTHFCRKSWDNFKCNCQTGGYKHGIHNQTQNSL